MTPRVLIVDDEPGVREMLQRMLTVAGFSVSSAENAESALEAIRTQAPDVVVCDVHMPGSNGLWLADRIRTEAPSTAIVLATGDADVPPAESLRKGIVAYVLKPFRPAKVLQAVRDAVQWSAVERRRRAEPR